MLDAMCSTSNGLRGQILATSFLSLSCKCRIISCLLPRDHFKTFTTNTVLYSLCMLFSLSHCIQSKLAPTLSTVLPRRLHQVRRCRRYIAQTRALRAVLTSRHHRRGIVMTWSISYSLGGYTLRLKRYTWLNDWINHTSWSQKAAHGYKAKTKYEKKRKTTTLSPPSIDKLGESKIYEKK